MKYCLKNIDSRQCVGLLVRCIEIRIWLEANCFSFHNLTGLRLPRGKTQYLKIFIPHLVYKFEIKRCDSINIVIKVYINTVSQMSNILALPVPIPDEEKKLT